MNDNVQDVWCLTSDDLFGNPPVSELVHAVVIGWVKRLGFKPNLVIRIEQSMNDTQHVHVTEIIMDEEGNKVLNEDRDGLCTRVVKARTPDKDLTFKELLEKVWSSKKYVWEGSMQDEEEDELRRKLAETAEEAAQPSEVKSRDEDLEKIRGKIKKKERDNG